ncbi:MAG: hypothetical protein AAB613_01445 [Patescibacteria group bacterium]
MANDISPDEELDVQVQVGSIIIAYETGGRLTHEAKEKLRGLACDPIVRRRIREVLIELGYGELLKPE